MAVSDDLRSWLLRGSFVTLLGRISFGAFAILQNAVLAHLLDGSDLGAYLLTQTVILPAMLFALWGNDLLAIAWIGAGRPFRTVVKGGASVVLALSLLLGVALAYGVFGISALSTTWALVASWHWWLVPLVGLSAVQVYLAALCRSVREIGRATLLNGVLSSGLLLFVSAGLYKSGARLTAADVILLQTGSLAVAVVWGLLHLQRHLQQAPTALPERWQDIWWEIWGSGGALMLTQVLAFVVTQSDIWIVSSFAEPDAVAGYALAARLAQLVSLPHLVLNGILPPLMASWFASQQVDRLNQVIGVAVQAALGIAISLALFYAVAGRPILQILFHGYGAWFDVLMILTLGNIANVATGPCSQMLIMAGRGRTLLWITALTSTACCGLGTMAGIWFGPRGTAVVFAVGLTVQGIVAAHWTHKCTQVRTYFNLRRPLWQALRL